MKRRSFITALLAALLCPWRKAKAQSIPFAGGSEFFRGVRTPGLGSWMSRAGIEQIEHRAGIGMRVTFRPNTRITGETWQRLVEQIQWDGRPLAEIQIGSLLSHQIVGPDFPFPKGTRLFSVLNPKFEIAFFHCNQLPV